MGLRIALVALVTCTPPWRMTMVSLVTSPLKFRAWFKGVKSHAGTPCCDIADGHAADYDMRENKYWVPINGEWMVVPPDAVVSDEGNPTGDAVVWYTMYNGTVYIRCFVPGGGA